jgi:hypothetical protein
MTLVAGATNKVRVEKAQVFFSKSGLSSHTLHYSNIKQDFHVKGLKDTIMEVRAAVRRRALEVHYVKPLHNNELRSGHLMEDPTLVNSQKVAHRVEYRLNALLSRVSRLFKLFEPVTEHVEEFARKNPKVTANLVFRHRHCHRRHLVQSHEISKWARIHPQKDLPAPSQEDRADQRHDSHRDPVRCRLHSDNLHSSGVGQAEREATEGGHRGKVRADGVKGNIQLTTGADQVDTGGCGLIGPVLGKH